MIEKQVLTTWYTPEEKLPPEGILTVVTFSGKDGNNTYTNAIGMQRVNYTTA